ncbi:MAG: hypothetical protein KF767_10665 [Bdellovibrionaceae bacterium]|nr:hypothetical protein [Pseudobdellovibrionaceae bacterium]
MDIRHAIGSLLPTNLRKKDPVERNIKSDSATDRDGNGQMPGQDKNQGEQKPPMSEEQLKKAMDHLKGLPVVKDHNLLVELLTNEGGKRFVLLKEPNGKLIRRIPEEELWTLQVVKETEKGQLLRKTA